MIRELNHPNLPGKWAAVERFWPVTDIDGTWLICTSLERRLLAGGGFEYRAALQGFDTDV